MPPVLSSLTGTGAPNGASRLHGPASGPGGTMNASIESIGTSAGSPSVAGSAGRNRARPQAPTAISITTSRTSRGYHACAFDRTTTFVANAPLEAHGNAARAGTD